MRYDKYMLGCVLLAICVCIPVIFIILVVK